ncbi:MAG: S41 family peptidase [Candidatus Odinarchaeota archaeon]
MNEFPEIVVNSIRPEDMTVKDWMEDFKSFYKIMKDNYPYFWVKERMLGYNWVDLKDQFLERIAGARSVIGILDVFEDAVTALQNSHANTVKLDHLDSYYQKGSFFQTQAPYPEIFTDTVKKAYDYWKPFMEEFFKERYLLNFDVLIFYCNGHYRIVNGHGSWKENFGEGARITAVNDVPVDEAVKSCYQKNVLEWDFKRKKGYIFKISPRTFGPAAEFTVRTSTGIEKKVVLRTGYDFTYSNPFGIPGERIATEILEEKKIAYVQIRDFEDAHAEEDHEKLLNFYKTVENFDYLIIDVRWNQGGSYSPWMMNVIAPLAKTRLSSKMYLAYRSGRYINLFREQAASDIGTVVPKEKFQQLPPEVLPDDFTVYDYTQTVEPSHEVNFTGQVIILTGMITFSATDAFALFCKETGFAKLYGTHTAGDGISESPVFYVLPNSKLVVRFTPAMGIDYTGNANEEVKVEPDVYYESDYGNPDQLVEHITEKLFSG